MDTCQYHYQFSIHINTTIYNEICVLFYFQNKARQIVHSFIVNIILFGDVIGCLVDTIITGFDKTMNNFEKKY